MRKMTGIRLAGIPWQEPPPGCEDVVWRAAGNPILDATALPRMNSVFNSAVVPFENGFAGVFRCDDRARVPRLHRGFSRDGVDWKLAPEPLTFARMPEAYDGFEYGYDPRVCRIDDRYWITWCNGYNGYPTIGMAWTEDFQRFEQMENAFLPFNRNGVLFPRKINGFYYMLSRPSDNTHTMFGDIFLSASPDLHYWGDHRLVMKCQGGWQGKKIGAGPTPIETDEGWLLFYHGVLSSCNGLVYSMGAALLDLERPWRVIARTREYLMAPKMDYERVGDVPNVVFPCAALSDSATGRIVIYYGCADTCVGMAFCTVDGVLEALKSQKQF